MLILYLKQLYRNPSSIIHHSISSCWRKKNIKNGRSQKDLEDYSCDEEHSESDDLIEFPTGGTPDEVTLSEETNDETDMDLHMFDPLAPSSRQSEEGSELHDLAILD